MSGASLRLARLADAPRLTQLVQAAYGHYVERLGSPPRPMTDDYADVVLLGVRPTDAHDLRARGRWVRLYVPCGRDWLRYFLRRLGEGRGA
jgi:hypothetical protein